MLLPTDHNSWTLVGEGRFYPRVKSRMKKMHKVLMVALTSTDKIGIDAGK